MTDWQQLFGGTGALSQRSLFKVLSRRKSPLLFLPGSAPAALATLTLYSAQNGKARLVKCLLSLALRLRLPLPLPTLVIPVDPGVSFVRFLAGFARTPPEGLPVWGMLAGNPNASGQRLVFLLFDREFRPCVAIKAGQGTAARALVAQEIEALRRLPSDAIGVPPLLGEWTDDALCASALALPFVSGESPSPGDIDSLSLVLTDWLRFGTETLLESLPGWRAACDASPSSRAAILDLLPAQSDAVPVRSPLSHGDLAPWNIKTAPGGKNWTVLDWERGTLRGVPGWDWFHYVLQPAVLVERLQPQALADRAGALLASDAFRTYAKAAAIQGFEQALLVAYLVHCTEVIRQTEGNPTLVQTRGILAERWKHGAA